jgi:hypothetical protein
MSFREKTAWVTLCAIIVVSLMYWLHVPSLFGPQPGLWVVHAMGLSLLAYLLIEVVAHVVLRIRHPRDARLPKDEREQLIDLKAIRIAYYVFATGALGGIPLMLHLAGAGSVAMAMAVFMAFVLSQIVKHAARIVFYRRGV